MNAREYYGLPDVRDGLNHVQRTILYVLYEAQKEFRGRSVPSILLYGRVVEILDMSEAEFIRHLQGLLTTRPELSEFDVV